MLGGLGEGEVVLKGRNDSEVDIDPYWWKYLDKAADTAGGLAGKGGLRSRGSNRPPSGK